MLAKTQKTQRAPFYPAAPLFQLLLSITACFMLHIALGFQPLGRDQGVWLSVGSALLSGKDFIADILHFNLPGLGISYALIHVFTDNPHITIAAASLFSCIFVIISGFYLLNNSANTRIALIFCWIFALIYPLSIDYYNIAQKDMLAMSWLMASLAVFQLSQKSKKSFFWLFISGLFVAFSVFHKPVFGIVGIFLALLECFRYKQRQSMPALLKHLTAMLLGFLV